MRTPMRTLSLVGLAAIFALEGCGRTHGSGSVRCTVGQAAGCACPDGRGGLQICGEVGIFGQCTCSAACPSGDGAYCGGPIGRDSTKLYQCTTGAYTERESCLPGTCHVSDARAADFCEPIAGPLCGSTGLGYYCGNDSMVNAEAGTLYHCPASNQAPDASTPCPSGCDVQPPGIADACYVPPEVPTCGNTGVGLYCGNDEMSNANASALYHCPGSYMAPDRSTPCPYGCAVMPPGTADFCATTPPQKPTGVHAAPGDSWAEIRWTPASAASGYTVSAQPGPMTLSVPGTANGAHFIGLSNGTVYRFTVTPVGGEASDFSNAVTPSVDSNLIANVPHRRQGRALTCEEASLSMALAHAGISRTEDEVLAQMVVDVRPGRVENGILRWGDPYESFVGSPDGSEGSLTGYGTYYPTIAQAAADFGATVLLAGEGFSASALYQEVLAGHPAEVWISYDWVYHPKLMDWLTFDGLRTLEWHGGVEHAVVVVGVTSDSVIVNDPLANREWQWVPKSTFEDSWRTYGNMAVVLE